ncbi:MAG TPA: heparinase II/III family protein [Stellaceae bacterium]|nr:heparinase II/III family protein [Stellaceae bacterium]
MAVATGDRRLRYRLWAAYCRTPAHRVHLWGRPPKDLVLGLDQRWPGDPRRGQAIVEGSYRFAGETVAGAEPPWDTGLAGAEFQAELHGFAWLGDLAAVASEAATETARALLRTWLERHDRWHPLVWRADVMGERLYAWIAYAELVAPEAGDGALRRAFLRSLGRQVRHLRPSAGWEAMGLGRLAALKGLLAAELALAAKDRELDAVLALLEAEATAQILPDGGHRARSPAAQLTALRHLIDARAALRAARIEVPQPLAGAIDRAAPMLRFFRHGDGRLALFNDSQEQEPAQIDLVLARSEAKGRAPASAPMSGFERLAAGKSVVIVDCGTPASERWGAEPHAGTLSFEMSHGRERLIVNCGAYRGPKAAWHAALRTTAAHSTLIVADTPSSELDTEGRILRHPRAITRERAEQDGSQWISASHDGYKPEFGLTHGRQLFLAQDGEDLRGEDRLSGKPGQSFAIRFHLHPQVQASLTQDGSAALLRLPSGVGWRLRAQGAVLSLAESVYLGTGEIRKTQQVVLQGHVGTQGATVKWAVRREGK